VSLLHVQGLCPARYTIHISLMVATIRKVTKREYLRPVSRLRMRGVVLLLARVLSLHAA
jgi:hypothetical protein